MTAKTQRNRYTAAITKGELLYVAQCLELGVVSQGETIEQAQANLKEAVELYIDNMNEDDLPASTCETLLYQFEIEVARDHPNHA